MINPHIYLVLSIVMVAASQFLFKKGVEILAERPKEEDAGLMGYVKMVFQPHIFIGLALNGFAAVTWLLALSHLELSYVFPYLSLNYILVPVGAYFLFREALSVRKFVGIAIICGGIFLIALS
ncbi:MAG: hypothetical protein AAFP02_01000 [Bacteroidota bacterium]